MRQRFVTIITLAVTNRSKSTYDIPFDSVNGPWIQLDLNNGSGWRRLPYGKFAVGFMTKPPGDGYVATLHVPPDTKEWKVGVPAEKFDGKTAFGIRAGTWAGSRLIPDFVWSLFERPQLSDNFVWSDSFTLDSIPKSNKAFEIASIRELLQRLAKAKTTRAQLQAAFSASFPLSELSYYNQGSPGWRPVANIYGNARITAKLSGYYSFVLCYSENVTAWVYLRNDDEVDDFDIVDEKIELPAPQTTPGAKQPNQN